MPHWGVYPFTREVVGLALAITVVLAVGFLLRNFLRARIKPEVAERLRRLDINRKGKLGDGEIIDFEGAAIIYSYRVGGVGYTAAQDVTTLADLLPADQISMIGPALVKFDPRNPANSIVVCEEWSGLRRVARDAPR